MDILQQSAPQGAAQAAPQANEPNAAQGVGQGGQRPQQGNQQPPITPNIFGKERRHTDVLLLSQFCFSERCASSTFPSSSVSI